MNLYYGIFKSPYGDFLYCYGYNMELQYCKWLTDKNEIPEDLTLKNWFFFEQKLNDYFTKNQHYFDLQLNFKNLSAYARKVLLEIQAIPSGQTLTYAQIAEKIKRPNSQRAVGRVCKNNPFPIVIPCHRVVAQSGPGGYAGEKSGDLFDIKVKLLEHEKSN